MGVRNKIIPDTTCFLTLTIVDWINIFSKPVYKHIITDSLNFCIEKKGLRVFSYCLMSNHLHMIVRAEEGNDLSAIIRDFKKFTSIEIIKAIKEYPESRRNWLLRLFQRAGINNNKIKNYKVWQDGNEAKEIYSNIFFDQKMDYIHRNPVTAEIVANPEDYLYSSARDYSGEQGFVKIELA